MDIFNDLELDNILEKVFEFIKSKFTGKEDKEDKDDKDEKNFTINLGITRIDYQKDIEGKEIILIIFIFFILYLFKNIF